MTNRPVVVAFDVIETLFSLSALEQRFEAAMLPRDIVPLWVSRILRDGFALELTGRFETFQRVAQSSLRVLLNERGASAAEASIPEILAGFTELEAHSDVAPAIAKLREGGVRLIALTNGSAKTTAGLLRRTGIDKSFENVISIDDVKHWKPAKEVYVYAAKAVETPPDRLALVAAHAWDVQGAKFAGLSTAWVARRERTFHPLMGQPDVKGADLEDVAAALLELPPAPRAATSKRPR